MLETNNSLVCNFWDWPLANMSWLSFVKMQYNYCLDTNSESHQNNFFFLMVRRDLRFLLRLTVPITLWDFALSPREEPVSNFTTQCGDGRRGCNPRQGPEKSLVGVGIELEALQSEDCHHNHQATGPD